ncbi:MAG: hypothetical protein A2845_05645 [Candidatus Lloydbacteria bacterium RIFCSPHIGHO2_01_FULL_49_22]|uniref:Uncharacterized protein n=1 Tax=Candidatus Lloydbacteria bacterium RIFCSPHIGHO2_01_FULL_49_22 TaxID=1798658 RepID=A0A1G2CTW1_9BACT|nr:MAG: hypothetical protein A2845_05645 [Candidatus Lloydbacteria bacterium RIFCSPHIGHO2_01_FULL_49_22]OGZ09680.1 MAG: hypothetical protein A3C14_02955 [Candidatus Lloydbacteria bacterium RIFCSPHIGHO2_02_FULL_50_18]
MMKMFIQTTRNLGLALVSLIAVIAFAAGPVRGPFSIGDGDALVRTITKSDSMEPFTDMETARVSFFSVAVFKKNTAFAKKGEMALILSTVTCTDKTIRRTMIEKVPVGSSTAIRLFQNDEGIAQSMQAQRFRKPTSAELSEVESVCRDYWRPTN